MTRYLLDTNAVITLLNDRDSPLVRRVRERHPSEIAISSIVAHELYYGAFKSRRVERNVNLVDALRFEVIELDREDARQSGKIRAALALAGRPIGPYDILIAGQALARQLILVTHNTAELGRVPGLVLQDWEG